MTELLQATPAIVPDREPGLFLADSTYVGPADFASAANPLGTTEILVSLDFSNGTQLAQLLSGLSDPSSPDYHHYLTHAQFDSEFGGDPAAYRSLLEYLQSFGVGQLATHPDRIGLSFQATPSEVRSIFGVALGDYVSASGQPYFAASSNPQLPSLIAPYIAEVQGFSNYSGYLIHADSKMVTGGAHASAGATLGRSSLSSAVSGFSVYPGGSLNPFATTNVSGRTYDKPVTFSSTTSCSSSTCGQMMLAPDLQVTYNETGLFSKYGYPVNATIVALLWSETACTSSVATCGLNGFYNSFCGGLTSGSYSWDFFMPDITSYWNYTLPSGEPMPHAVSMATTGSSSYAYPTGSQGYSASCDSGAANEENTLDVAMVGAMAPGANVVQVFGQGSTTASLTTEFSDILSPTTSEFTGTGGFDTPRNIANLSNTSVIANSWGSTSSLGTSTAWVDDLKEAQTLGITVLASSGDSGNKVLSAPAENAYNAYGAVAVGGTTVVVDPTTLLRTPGHLASMASPHDGVGGGEIVWYMPGGTVAGFGSTAYGTVGGVTSSSTNYAPTWQNSSADAHGVVTGITSSGYGRGEPDLSAIANDTPVNLDEATYSFNVTCLVSSGCSRISSIGGGTVTVTWTFFIGTSISDQVAGGEIGLIDYALHRSHEPWVGFVNPAAYAAGQLEDSGKLTLHSFADVTVYHNAQSSSTYGAFTGWDADTGWGTIDTGNYSQNTLTYTVKFTESGLTAGTSWSVTLTPTIGDANCTVSGSTCSNGLTRSSTTSAISFARTYGIYGYVIGSVSGYGSSPSSGTERVDGGNVSQSVSFVAGLPAAPTGLTATPTTATAVTLSWTNPSGTLTGNHLYAYSGSSCTGSPFYVYYLASLTGFHWAGLSPSATYSWEVTAVSPSGEGPPSSCASATTFSVPGAPTGLTATAVSATAVNLGWTNPPGTLTGNHLYGYSGTSCAGSPFYVYYLGSVGTSFHWAGLSPLTAYSWEVTAVSAYGESAPSSCGSTTTFGVPGAPTGLTATAATATAVNLAWTNPSGTLSDNHLYEFSGGSCSGSPSYVYYHGSAVTGFHWTGLSASTTYSWEVTAVSAYGEGAPSSCASATTYSVPSAPTGLTATATTATAVNLAWTNPSGTLTGNHLYAYAGGSCAGSPFYMFYLGSAVTSFHWTGLSPSTSYSWGVTAISAYGESAPSNCASATTYSVPSAPTGLSATPVSASAVNLAWTNPSGTLTDNHLYAFSGGSCSGTPFYVYYLGSAATSFHWTGLSASTTYSWEVTAVSAYGESSPSGCASATTP